MDKQLQKRLADAKTLWPILKKVSLRRMLLKSSKSDVNLINGKLPDELQQKVDITGTQLPDNVLLFHVSLLLTGNYPEKTENTPFMIGAVYLLSFENKSGVKLNPNLQELIGQHLAVGIVWPLWRELVLSLSSKMGIPPLIVPLKNAQDFIPDEKKAPKKVLVKKKIRK